MMIYTVIVILSAIIGIIIFVILEPKIVWIYAIYVTIIVIIYLFAVQAL